MFKYGFYGKLCKDGYFTAISTKNDISCGTNEEYVITHKHVVQDFIYPLK